MADGSQTPKLETPADTPFKSDAGFPEAPANIEAEQQVLGEIMRDNEAFWEISSILKPEHFIEPVHARIFEALSTLIAQGRRADGVVLKEEFDRDPDLADSGGAKYLVRCMGSAYAPDIKAYAKIIRDLSIRRYLIGFSAGLHLTMWQLPASADPRESVNNVLDTLVDLDSGTDAVRISSAFDGVQSLRELRRQMEAGEKIGTSTGIKSLDFNMGTLVEGDLVVLAGRPSMGKTALACEIARRVTDHKDENGERTQGVAFFSLEMSTEQLMSRIISANTVTRDPNLPKVAYEKFYNNEMNANEAERWTKAEEKSCDLPLAIADGRMSVADIHAEAVRIKRKLMRMGKTLNVIVIDYLQLIMPEDSRVNRAVQLGEITRALKGMAKRLGVSIILLSQLNRGLESRDDKRPQLQDLKESGSIEEDADKVVFVYRQHYYLSRMSEPTDPDKAMTHADILENVKHIMEAIVAKRRMGKIGTAYLHCELEYNFVRDR